MRTGDVATSGRFAESTMDKLARSKSGQVVSWCPSCHVQFTETTLPTIEKTRGARPFEMTPFMLFLRGNLDRLRPFLRRRVDMRVALHRHPGITGVVEAAEDVLRAVPGVELIDLKQPAVGLMSKYSTKQTIPRQSSPPPSGLWLILLAFPSKKSTILRHRATS
jgi:hypothetical protein